MVLMMMVIGLFGQVNLDGIKMIKMVMESLVTQENGAL